MGEGENVTINFKSCPRERERESRGERWRRETHLDLCLANLSQVVGFVESSSFL